MVALRLRDGRHYHVRMGANAGFVSCKKKNRNAKNMASAGARAYMGDRAKPPPEAEGILLPKRANLSLSFK